MSNFKCQISNEKCHPEVISRRISRECELFLEQVQRSFTSWNTIRFADRMTKAGFTLAETLVVIAVISIVGVIATEIFLRSVRGSNQAQIVAALRQNGQIALDQMDKTIRGSDAVVCITTDTLVVSYNRNQFVSPINARYTRFRFINPTGTTNGKIQQDNPTAFSPTLCQDNLSSPITISDSGTKIGASVTNGSFVPDKKDGYKEAVIIKFNVAPGVGTPQTVSKNIDPVSFNTTIVLR